MGFFTVIKIAIVSLLLIYVAHLIWGYYMTKSETALSNSSEYTTNSALRESKRMYEEMARVIQNGEISNMIPSSDSPIEPSNLIPHTYKSSISEVNEALDTESMQEELKVYMNNIT
jgi:hypothetical protein